MSATSSWLFPVYPTEKTSASKELAVQAILNIDIICSNDLCFCRKILSSALGSPSDEARHYATKFLRVLVRAKFPGFSNWGIELLVNQLNDKNGAIALSALDILEEAIHDKVWV